MVRCAEWNGNAIKDIPYMYRIQNTYFHFNPNIFLQAVIIRNQSINRKEVNKNRINDSTSLR